MLIHTTNQLVGPQDAREVTVNTERWLPRDINVEESPVVQSMGFGVSMPETASWLHCYLAVQRWAHYLIFVPQLPHLKVGAIIPNSGSCSEKISL